MKTISLILLLLLMQNPLFSQYAEQYQSDKEFNFKQKLNNNTTVKQSALMDKYDVKFYKLDISVEHTSVYVEGNVSIVAKVIASQLDTFAFELKDYFTIDSIKINNQIKTFNRLLDDVFVGIGPLSAGANLTAQIFYKGLPPNTGTFFSGISCETSSLWGNQICWTLSQPFGAKEWFPVKQSLTDKADSAYIFVTTANDNKVGSEGILTAIVPLPNNKLRYEWKARYPIDYYLISIAVGQYVEYNIYAHPGGMSDSLLIQNYIYDNPSALPYYKNEIDRTPGFIELFSDLFGLYPFHKEKYGHSMAPMGGGMEHQTMTTLSDFNFYLTSHELSHQWWGDNITCATWSDIWINEGFASYAEYLAAQYKWSYQEAQNHMKVMHDSIMAYPNGSVYIPPFQINDVNRIFDGRLSYKKGAAIIHNLRFEIANDSIFFKVLKTIQTRFKDSTITGLDVKAVAEEFTGKNFTDFFNQWYFGEGYPTFNIISWLQNDTLVINTDQQTSATTTPLFKMLMEYKLQSPTGDTIIKLYHSANIETFKIPMQKPVSGLVVDPNNWVINGKGNIVFSVINENYSSNLLLYPNPCSDILEIYMANTKNENYQLSIFDVCGKLIFNENILMNVKNKINVQFLRKGIYFLELKNENKKSIQKFIKN
ncbi:MAG: M1 family aminopeptidase [Bacteroidetes bacterium]|nr:M1 family aminopeptidase [Bacteroidota bacterium]